MKRVAEGLYQLEAGGFVNAYLIEGTADLSLVDTGHARSAPALLAELRDNGFAPKDIGRIIVTHAHADHAGGLAALLELHPAKVFAHPQESGVLLGDKPKAPFTGLRGYLLDAYHARALAWKPVSSVLPLAPGMPLRGLPQWQILHTPGHTAGSLSLFHPVRQILLCGDALVSRKGRPALPEPACVADPAALRGSVAALAKLDCDILCCGHGPIVRGGAFRHIEALLAPDPKN